MDFANAKGTPLYAVYDLAVSYAGADTGSMNCAGMGGDPPYTGYGSYIKGTTPTGYTLIYGHIDQLNTSRGANEPRGAVIGTMGKRGCSTGYHLHLTVYGPDGRERNPFDILEEP